MLLTPVCHFFQSGKKIAINVTKMLFTHCNRFNTKQAKWLIVCSLFKCEYADVTNR